jgi:NADH dehydrogenase [ubiquinone] 1 alpha subcomplex assembly factor 2
MFHSRVEQLSMSANMVFFKELQMDLARQQRVLANVALIEARDQEEHAQMLRLNAAAPAAPVPNNTIQGKSPPLDESLQAPADSPSPDARLSNQRQQLHSRPEPYAPQSWVPRARSRGGER